MLRQEVIANILKQPIGGHQVADLGLPPSLLGRLADREIRSTFENRFRIVAGETPPQPPREAGADDRLNAEGWRLVLGGPPVETTGRWRALAEARPENRAFHVAGIDPAEFGPLLFDALAVDPRDAEARRLVATRLARDGLLPTLAASIEALGPDDYLKPTARSMARLAAVGLPTDLLRHFHSRTHPQGDLVAAVASLVSHRRRGQAPIEFNDLFEFEWRPSNTGFKVCLEDGGGRVVAVRAQATRGDDWQGPGDGGNIDMLRQLAAEWPKAAWTISIEGKHLGAFFLSAGDWPWDRSQVSLLGQDLPVGQWAQDNGKAGFVPGENDRVSVAALMAPRYASRGDDGSTFIPGEALAAEMAGGTGRTIVRSGLLFQGGDVLAVEDPQAGGRLLLVGDAEIARNTALGLTAEQVREAFKAEFGVDRVEVVETASFHLDCDTTIRRHQGRSIAFVNDPTAAAWIMMECGARTMESHGRIGKADLAAALAALKGRDVWGYVNAAGGRVFAAADAQGCFPLALADDFSAGGLDSGVGNLERYLSALDHLMALAMSEAQLPQDRVARGYMQAIVRQERSRSDLQTRLRSLGFEVVSIPSLSNLRRGVCPINGVHDKGRYLMPAYGGLFAPLDAAAREAFRASLGDGVEVRPVRSGESQRRAGALHCSISTWTGP